MKILVAYDGSPAVDAAIDHVLVRPWPKGTQIRVLSVTVRRSMLDALVTHAACDVEIVRPRRQAA